MEKKRSVILILIIFLSIPVFTFAETIVLKSGKTVEGKIVERTNEYIKVEIEDIGTPLIYFLDDVESINGVKPVLATKETEAVSLSDTMKEAPCIVATSDRQYYIAGLSYSDQKGQSFWIWKVDGEGEVIWQKNFKSENQDQVTNMIATDDGGVLVLGEIFVYEPEIGYTCWIKKLDKNGDTAYTKIIRGYENAYVILRTDDGNYLLGGTRLRNENKKQLSSDAWLMKIDSSGEVLWEQFYDKGLDECIYSGVNTVDGGFVFLGTTGQYNKFGQGPSEIWVFKCDSTGKIVAETKLPDGRIMNIGGHFIAKNKEEFAVVYSTSQLPPIGNVDLTKMPSFNAQIVGFNYDLKKLWEKQITGYFSVMTPLITTTTDGNYLVVGAVQKGPKVDKIASGGKEIWSKTIQDNSGKRLMYNARGIVSEGTECSVVGDVMDTMSVELHEEIFLFKMQTDTPNTLWQKSY